MHQSIYFCLSQVISVKVRFLSYVTFYLQTPKITHQVHLSIDKLVVFSVGSPLNKIHDKSLCIKTTVNEKMYVLLTVLGPVFQYIVLKCNTKPKESRFLGMIMYIQKNVGWSQDLFLTVRKGLGEGDGEHTGDGYLSQTVDWCCEKPSSRSGGTTSQLCFSHVAVSKSFRKNQHRNRQVWCSPAIPP